MSEQEILSYIFTYNQLQPKTVQELFHYCEDKECREILKLLHKCELPISIKDFVYTHKEHMIMPYIHKEIFTKELDIGNELFLTLLTKQIKEYRFLKIQEKIAKEKDSSKLASLKTEMEHIEKFNLNNDFDFVSFRDVAKVKKLSKVEHSDGFFTGYAPIDAYVKESNGFTPGSFVTIVAPPHTGKCVVGNTQITIQYQDEYGDDSYINTIAIQQLFQNNFSHNYDEIEDEKFTKVALLKKDVSVWTNTGFKPIKKIYETKPMDVYEITLDNGLKLQCADEHIVATTMGLRYIKELIVGESTLITDTLYALLIKMEKINKQEIMYDIELEEELKIFKLPENLKNVIVGDYICHKNLHYEMYKVVNKDETTITIDYNNHLYYTNNILSHNTLFLTTIASKAIKNLKNVLYFSFEMSEVQILKRIYVNIFGKTMKTIYGEMDDVFEMLDTMNTDMIGELYVKEYPSSFCTPSMIENILKNMKEQKEINPKSFFPDILVIDQLTTMGSDLKAGVGMYERGKAGIERLKALGQEYKLIIFSAAQANRGALKSEEGVQMDNVAESWGIPQITDVGFGAMVDKTSVKESDPDYYDLTVTCFKNRLTGNQNPTIWSVNKQKMNFVERRY